jgi:phosphoglucosamine mutase
LIVRPSGTEPVVRVTGEGENPDLIEAVVDEIVDALNEVAVR